MVDHGKTNRMYVLTLLGIFGCLATSGQVAAAQGVADAAMQRDSERLQRLVEQKAAADAPQADGTTGLHWAARWDDLDSARLLLDAGADPTLSNRAGITPLYLAALNGSAPMIKALLDSGADPNTRVTTSGETVLMTAANTGKPEAVRLLLERGAEVDAREAVKGQTALMWAAAENHVEVVRLLVNHGADINACTHIDLKNTARGFIITGPGVAALPWVAGKAAVEPEPVPDPQARTTGRRRGPPLGGSGGGGMTPLLFAIRQGHVDTVRVLLEAGADVDQTMADGTGAMIVAIVNGQYALASELLSRGGDANVKDLRGRAALYAAVDMRNYRWSELPKPPDDGMDPLALIRQLLDLGVDVNAPLTSAIPYRGPSNFSNIFESMVGATPFLRAAESGDATLMRLLMDHGADVHVTTGDGKTALILAAGVGYSDGSTFEWSEKETLGAIELCLAAGIDVNAASATGMTALLGAAHRGSNAIVQYLVSHGADLHARDSSGRGALDWAAGVVVIAQRPAREQPHTVALLRALIGEERVENRP